MTAKPLVALAVVLALAGCASRDEASEGASQDLTSDTSTELLIEDAISGLQTNGYDGTPGPFSMSTFDLYGFEDITDAILETQLAPKIDALTYVDGIPGVERFSASSVWPDYTSDPTAADGLDPDAFADAKAIAAQWRKVKDLFDNGLTGVTAVDMGNRSKKDGDLDVGPVAHVIYGRERSGRVVAIWGVDTRP